MAIGHSIYKPQPPGFNPCKINWQTYGPPQRILCLKDGSFLDNMTFFNEEAAVKYLLNHLNVMETINCGSFQELKDFRKSYGMHMFDIVEA